MRLAKPLAPAVERRRDALTGEEHRAVLKVGGQARQLARDTGFPDGRRAAGEMDSALEVIHRRDDEALERLIVQHHRTAGREALQTTTRRVGLRQRLVGAVRPSCDIRAPLGIDHARLPQQVAQVL